MPSCPGIVPISPPATPDLAGMPTLTIQRPEPSYMPADVITACVTRLAAADMMRSPVIGWTPPLAKVAAITARSRTVTRMEHCCV